MGGVGCFGLLFLFMGDVGLLFTCWVFVGLFVCLFVGLFGGLWVVYLLLVVFGGLFVGALFGCWVGGLFLCLMFECLGYVFVWFGGLGLGVYAWIVSFVFIPL